MRVLQLLSKPPVPAVDGGCLASSAMTNGLLEAGCLVQVVCAGTDKHPFSSEAMGAAFPGLEGPAIGHHISTRLGLWGKVQLFLGWGRPSVDRFYNAGLAHEIRAAVRDFNPDIVLLEGLFVGVYLPDIIAAQHARRQPTTKLVLRSHNREHLIWERLAEHAPGLFKRAAFLRVAANLKKAEAHFTAQIDAIMPLSKVEAQSWREDGWRGNLHVAGFGMEPGLSKENQANPAAGTDFKLGHLGALNWGPNRQGVEWFLRQVWPEIHRAHPRATFHLAGRHIPKKLTDGVPGVVLHGEVKDGEVFCRSLDLLVVPLLSGGGIRIKIVEHMMRGGAVLATRTGAEGIDIENGVEGAVVEPGEFAQAAIEAIAHPEVTRRWGAAARAKAVNLFDRDRIGMETRAYFESIMNEDPAAACEPNVDGQAEGKPKLFVLAPRVPHPTEKGDKLRMREQLQELTQLFEVHLTCLAFGRTADESFDVVRSLVHTLHVEKLPLTRAALRLALAPFAKRPYQVLLYTDRWVMRRIRRRIAELQPDGVYCQMIRTSEYVKDLYAVPKTLDIMDTLSVGMAREAERAAWWKRGLLKSEARRLRLYEHRMIEYFDACCIISEQDRDLLPHPDRQKVHVIANGVRTDYFDRDALPEQKPRFDVAFCGNLQYAPNVAACRFLAREIAPAFAELTGRPLKVLLCGASPTAAVRALSTSHIEVRGWVDDIRTAYLDAKIFAAPMVINTGLQNKLLEAMALGIPCVTTSMSFNAMQADRGREVQVCDTTQQFASTFENLLKNPEIRRDLGEAGRRHVREACSWEAATLKLASILNTAKIRKHHV
ncbi:MAG: glycosyltransferase [Flavobacteriales bacterium]|nr:glycosyltransferase [Flavobacteriales bacterium]